MTLLQASRIPVAGAKGGNNRSLIRPKLRISQPDAGYEREADRIADQVMKIPNPDEKLQRACSCGGTCEDCKKEAPKSGPVRNDHHPFTPSAVHEVLRSRGQPLDAATRGFMESRFGHDFSMVRIHTDERAAESADAVGALAYTVGNDVVFAKGQHVPGRDSADRLLAHELAHVVQQRGIHDRTEKFVTEGLLTAGQPSTFLQRACLSAAQCAVPRTTLEEFVKETESKPENISKADKRKKACTKVPRDPACTSDGHGSPAPALTAIVKANYPSRLGYISGIFVDKDIPSAYGAYTGACASFVPPLPGGQCTFVPDTLEAQGKLYQGGAAGIAGQSRKDWLTSTIGTLTHETEHARFDTASPIPEPNPTSCKFADQEANLSELAAHLSEMHVYYRGALSRPSTDRFKRFYEMFDFWVKNGSEDISGIVKDLRCKCECADANHFISKTAESVSTNQKWDSNERFVIHTELREPKWALNWPVAPPASVDVGDLPTTAPAPLKFE